MISYKDSSMDVLDLTGNIHTIEDIYIRTNTRKKYFHLLINFMTFLFTDSPGFLVFPKKNKHLTLNIYNLIG